MTNAENLLVRCYTILHRLSLRPLSVQMLVDMRDEYRMVQDELKREVARLREDNHRYGAAPYAANKWAPSVGGASDESL